MPTKPPHVLSLTTTSINNVVISNQSDAIYYEVVTPKWTPNSTRISRMDPNSRELDVVAEVVAEEYKRPVVRLRGEQFHPAEDFVKTAKVGNEDVLGRFKGKDGNQYIWREKKGHLELVREDEQSESLAIYHHEKRYLMVLRMRRQPYLEIHPSLMETLDSVIVSFLLTEHKRRRHKRFLTESAPGKHKEVFMKADEEPPSISA